MSKDEFQSRFGDDPRRDDMTLLNPKQDDPTEQVTKLCPHQNLQRGLARNLTSCCVSGSQAVCLRSCLLRCSGKLHTECPVGLPLAL